jgi:zinc transport system substrate-binding protein
MRPAFALILSITLASCGDKPSEHPAPPSDGKTVLTTFYPTQYFAERIAGDSLTVDCPVPEGADPIFWQPDRGSLQRYQAADLIIINGAQFEKWLATASLPESRIVDTAKSFEQDFIRYETTTHKHGSAGEHSHDGIDGHTWLDPINAKVQAATIRQELAKRWPEHAAAFEKNFAELVADLDALDAACKEVDPAQAILASHPAYNYIARRYGWRVTNVDLDPETLPAKDAIPAGHPAKVILWESMPREKTIALLEKQHGLKSIVFSPAELKGEEDYLATMHANIARLKEAQE